MNPRPDLVEALVQGCWLVETARSRILRRWGLHWEGAAERADMIAAIGIESPAAYADAHTAWMTFVVVPGDITDDGEPEQYDTAAALLAGLDCPVHCVLGNHDAIRRSTVRHEGHELFAAAFGRPAQDVVVECGELQIALLDSTDPV